MAKLTTMEKEKVAREAKHGKDYKPSAKEYKQEAKRDNKSDKMSLKMNKKMK